MIGVLLFVGAMTLVLAACGWACDTLDRYERNELTRARGVYGRAAKRAREL